MRTLLGLLFLLALGTQAHASWVQLDFKDGTGKIAFYPDITTKSAIGIMCSGNRLSAVAMPAPKDFSGPVEVKYEVDGIPFDSSWPVLGGRLVADEKETVSFLARMTAAKGAIWFSVGNQPRSLAMVDGMAEKFAPVLAFCGVSR